MVIQSKNFSLKLEEIPRAKKRKIYSNETERKALELITDWMSGTGRFRFTTSGSTGTPKTIEVERSKIEYSAKATLDAIDSHKRIKSSLLCINPTFIGGAMVVFRALIGEHELYISEPSASPLGILPEDYSADLVSLVPLQFKSLEAHQLSRFKNVLVGGGPLHQSNEKYRSNIYSTYGMTETVSHIALRRINEDRFRTVGDIMVSHTDDECLKFKGTITDNEWIETHDLGIIHSPHSFEWIGRKDFIINSGGIKINPEAVEDKLAVTIKNKFIVSSIPNETLGEMVVIGIEGDLNEPLDFTMLTKYETPKRIIQNLNISYLESGKVDRLKTRQNILSSYED